MPNGTEWSIRSRKLSGTTTYTQRALRTRREWNNTLSRWFLCCWSTLCTYSKWPICRAIGKRMECGPQPSSDLDGHQFSVHSLRSGFLTSAAANGANLFRMMDVSRHRSVNTVCGYMRKAQQFEYHAGSAFM